MNSEEFFRKHEGQTFYFSNEFEQAVVKMTPAGSFVKFKGKGEFLAMKGSGVVAEAYREGKMITKEEYDSF